MDLKIKNKIALVTGGATGIGKAVAIDLAKEGAIVVITSRNKKSLQKTLFEIRELSPKSIGLVIDITKKNQPKILVKKIIKKFSSLDIVVNNVGDTLNIMNPYCSVNDWIKLFKLILGVAIEINNLVITYMKRKKWGQLEP